MSPAHPLTHVHTTTTADDDDESTPLLSLAHEILSTTLVSFPIVSFVLYTSPPHFSLTLSPLSYYTFVFLVVFTCSFVICAAMFVFSCAVQYHCGHSRAVDEERGYIYPERQREEISVREKDRTILEGVIR